MTPAPRPWLLPLLTVIGIAIVIWSFLGAGDKPTWAFEVLPLVAVLAVFGVRTRWFRFSDL